MKDLSGNMLSQIHRYENSFLQIKMQKMMLEVVHDYYIPAEVYSFSELMPVKVIGIF